MSDSTTGFNVPVTAKMIDDILFDIFGDYEGSSSPIPTPVRLTKANSELFELVYPIVLLINEVVKKSDIPSHVLQLKSEICLSFRRLFEINDPEKHYSPYTKSNNAENLLYTTVFLERLYPSLTELPQHKMSLVFLPMLSAWLRKTIEDGFHYFEQNEYGQKRPLFQLKTPRLMFESEL